MIFVVATGSLVHGQAGGTSSPLSGTVVDASGGVIPGAEVTVKNNATGAEFKTMTADNGRFFIPALNNGTYSVTVSMAGFKQAVIKDVDLQTGTPASVRIVLQIGDITETVVVQGGGDIVQAQSATISTTMVVNQVSNLPLTSRNAGYSAIMLPGVQTPGGVRESTIVGLPQSAINITIDGLNAQDNYNKRSDGFYTKVRPGLDAVEEMTLSTAGLDAGSSSQGSVQIKMVTRQGSNEFHGSIYEYHRDPALNANYWFNNRDLPPDPRTGKAPRDRILLNQFGFRVGGPIMFPKLFDGHNKAFFFVNWEDAIRPTGVTRQRTIFSPPAEQGVFQYNVNVGAQSQVRQVNLLQLAASKGQTPTIDPVIGKLLADIRATTSRGGVQQLTDPNLQQFSFTNKGIAKTPIATARLDFNLTNKHHLTTTFLRTDNFMDPDFNNNYDAPYPDFPAYGSLVSWSTVASLALRSALSSTLVNEARVGLTVGPTIFGPKRSAAAFSGPIANQAGFNLGINAAGISSATTGTNTRRNAPTRLVEDALFWTRGTHNLSFGGSFTQCSVWLWGQTVVPSTTFGVDTSDPAIGMFTTANFPNAAAADLTRAQNIYAVLTGRITAITANAVIDETTNKYVYSGARGQRGRLREWGFFAEDSWRVRQGLTFNYGLRWELQLPFVPLESTSTTASVADVYGISGFGNLFKPGVATGRETQFVQFTKGTRAFNTDYRNFGPSVGLAWSPSPKQSWLKRLLGENGKTVIRGGYSIAYERTAMSDFTAVYANNPGATITASRSTQLGNLVTGVGNDVLPVLLRQTNRLEPPSFATTPTYPITGAISNSVTIFEPNLKMPYAQSWSFGIQREITRDMALEVRYLATRYKRGLFTYNLNEPNIVENGFLNEFKLAEANLQANIAAGRGSNFKYYGPNTGTSPLPIILAYFSGIPASQANDPSKYISSQFSTSTFLNTLAVNNPNPCCGTSSFSYNLYNDAGRRSNALNAGLPANFFLVNPGLQGGANVRGNGVAKRYDSLAVELRRRLSHGLLVQASYAFAKGFDSSTYSFRAPRVKTMSSDLGRAFKLNWVYDLPFGKGKTLFGGVGGGLDRLVGGWQFHGSARIQSGQILNFGNVNLVGMTMHDLQEVFKLRFDDANKVVYSLPQDIIDNTIRAFSVSATSATGYGALGPPSGRYLAPANNARCIQVVRGDCAPQNVFVTGPRFTRFDLSIAKKVRISERVVFDLRAELLDAFNNINFLANTNLTNFTSATFAQVTSAYRDVSDMQDPGGRLFQVVARISW